MVHHISLPAEKNLQPNWLYLASGAAAMAATALLMTAVIDLLITVLYPTPINSWLAVLQNNWLIVIFKLHADFSGVQPSLLYRLNVLDLGILALIAILYIGLYLALQSTSKLWSLIALALPIMGMVLFIATKIAGRCSVMGAELLISMVMLRSKLFDRRITYAGMVSGLLLLAGDIGVSIASSNILAVLMGVGYILLVCWLFLVGFKLFQFGQASHAR